MKKSSRKTEQSTSYSSRLRLGWLLLLLLMTLIFYAYFSYSSSFGSKLHKLTTTASPDESTRTKGVSMLTAELNGGVVKINAPSHTSDYYSADHDRNVAVPYEEKVTSKTDISLHQEASWSLETRTKKREGESQNGISSHKYSDTTSKPHAVVKPRVIVNEVQNEPQVVSDSAELTLQKVEEEPPAFEDENEIAEFAEGFADQDYANLNITGSDYLLEMDSENTNTSSNSEFGVVFSEYEPNNDNFGSMEVAEEDEVLSEVEMNSIEEQERQLELEGMFNDTDVVDSSLPSSSPAGTPVTSDHATELEILLQNSQSTLPSPATTPMDYREKMLSTLEHFANRSNPHCTMSQRFTSWEEGIVTQVGNPIKRNCEKLRHNSKSEVNKVKSQVASWKKNKPWEHFALRYKEMSCEEIRREFENNFYVSETEKDFPIAYIFVVYTNAGQVLRLLKTIYRPQNLYCIHPDTKQGQNFASFFKAIAKCLDNVFVVSRPIRVYYGHHSIMDSQLHCMQDLVKYPETRWKYVINLCGREVPVKTNREIVESLQKLKGYTALNLRNLTPNYRNTRFRYKFRLNRKGHMARTRQRQSKPPKGIKLYKSMNFIAASRAFVQFMVNDPLSKRLQKYLSTVFAPEEHYYSSLYALPRAKGARPPKGLLGRYDMPIVDNFIWVNTKFHFKHARYFCPGRRIVHGICILTTPDLGKIEKKAIHSRQPVFFFNKYFLEWDPTPMDCMEERIVRTNIEEYWHDCVSVDKPKLF